MGRSSRNIHGLRHPGGEQHQPPHPWSHPRPRKVNDSLQHQITGWRGCEDERSSYRPILSPHHFVIYTHPVLSCSTSQVKTMMTSLTDVTAMSSPMSCCHVTWSHVKMSRGVTLSADITTSRPVASCFVLLKKKNIEATYYVHKRSIFY